MPTLVHFGAGQIGRGFVAPLFTGSGWEVVFVDVAPALLQALVRFGGYTVTEVSNEGEKAVSVRNVRGIDGKDAKAVACAIAKADLLSTSVGLNILPRLGGVIAQGLIARATKPLDILICENGAEAHHLLQKAITDAAAGKMLPPFSCVRTSIGRMVPPSNPSENPLDIRVEPYAKLPVAAKDFIGAIPAIKGLIAKPDFTLVLREKLYLHNLTHACLGYMGNLRGLIDVPAAMADSDCLQAMLAAGRESIEALARAHGKTPEEEAQVRRDCTTLLEDLCGRYLNRALADPLERVARDPIRKLAGDDRLVGAARLCLEHGIRPMSLAHRILDACRYTCGAEDPARERWATLRSKSWKEILSVTANLSEKEPLMSVLNLAARQQAVAQAIRNAGMTVTDAEAREIEIADFGLNRFEEIGLGILVYVNTKRCCAKELVLLPGQICPEHRHPDVDGEPGKEETFRCRKGEVFLFLPGDNTPAAKARGMEFIPKDKQKDAFSVFRCIHLKAGEQATLGPDTLHWFVAGKDGAVVSEFSTRSRDGADIFTDAAIQRVPVQGPHKG